MGKGSQLRRHRIASAADTAPTQLRTSSVYFDGGRVDTPVYDSDALLHGHVVEGPALVVNNTSTVVVEPRCTLSVTEFGDLVIDVHALADPSDAATADAVDPIQLSIFSHRCAFQLYAARFCFAASARVALRVVCRCVRFMGIAEQMGKTLQVRQFASLFARWFCGCCVVHGGLRCSPASCVPLRAFAVLGACLRSSRCDCPTLIPSVCPPCAAANLCVGEHQGAPGLQLRAVRARRRSRRQRAAHPRAPGSHAGGCALPARPLG